MKEMIAYIWRVTRATQDDSHPVVWRALTVALLWGAAGVRAETFTLSTLLGDVQIPLMHVDTGGGMLTPSTPGAPPFTAPTIFSAPLPSGSGARALGAGGAFTAIADDATAASWNPAGLIQLERPEVSAVFRMKREYGQHRSIDADYQVGEDDWSSHALNYFSAVTPVRILDRNAVVSINLQEVFDFSQRFHAAFSHRSETRSRQTQRTTASARVQSHYAQDNGYIDVTEMLTTIQTTTLDQRVRSLTQGHLDFEQKGSVQALSPAFAVEVTPRFSLGAAFNLYLTGLTDAEDIRSRTRARYSGMIESTVSTRTQRRTTGSYSYEGTYISPDPIFPGGPVLEIDFGPEAGDLPAYTSSEASTTVTRQDYEGFYDVDDRIEDFRGINGTFGALWSINSRLTAGACLDLPWEAEAEQTKTVHSGVSIGQGPLSEQSSSDTRDVTFDFPLYWAVGAAWRWTDRLTSSLDVSQTLWSDYAYQADGDRKSNPLDGTPYGEHPVDDCWAIRTGLEYLWVLSKTEIPLRLGYSREQRPAVGSPDIYHGLSLGSGISIGQGAHKVIIDVAYTYTRGQDVMETLVPGQTGRLATDVDRHDLYISCIYHF